MKTVRNARALKIILARNVTKQLVKSQRRCALLDRRSIRAMLYSANLVMTASSKPALLVDTTTRCVPSVLAFQFVHHVSRAQEMPSAPLDNSKIRKTNRCAWSALPEPSSKPTRQTKNNVISVYASPTARARNVTEAQVR